jgi:O-antigen/teichoic acid export membrane protein
MKKAFHFLRSTSGSLKTRTVRSGIWVSLASVFSRSFNLISSIILARLLLPEIFGLMGIVLFVRQGIEVFTQTSFKQALIYKKDDIEKSSDTAWILNVVRGFILFAVVYVTAPWISAFYNQPVLSTALRFVALLFVLGGFNNINMVLFDRALDFKKVAISRVIGSFLVSAATLVLAFILRSIWALLLGLLLRSLYDLAASYIIQKKRPRIDFNTKMARELIRYSKYLTGAGILLFFTTQGDDAIIGKILGMEELGFYTYAYLIANIPATHFTNMISEVFFPSYSAISHDSDRLKNAFLSIYKFIAYVSIPVGVTLFVFSEEIVTLMLGQRWEPAVAPLQILVAFGIVRSLAATTGPVFKAIGKPNVTFWLVLVKLVLIISALYPLTKYYGLMGAALAVTVPMVLEQLYLWTLMKRFVAISVVEIVKQLRNPLLVSVLMGAILIAAKSVIPAKNILFLGLYILFALIIWGSAALLCDQKYFVEKLRA